MKPMPDNSKKVIQLGYCQPYQAKITEAACQKYQAKPDTFGFSQCRKCKGLNMENVETRKVETIMPKTVKELVSQIKVKRGLSIQIICKAIGISSSNLYQQMTLNDSARSANLIAKLQALLDGKITNQPVAEKLTGVEQKPTPPKVKKEITVDSDDLPKVDIKCTIDKHDNQPSKVIAFDSVDVSVLEILNKVLDVLALYCKHQKESKPNLRRSSHG